MVSPSSEPFSQLEFWLTIALASIPGVLGGITYGVSIFLKEIKAKKPDWPPSGHLSKTAFFWAQALTGMGGALAALLVTLWANHFPSPFYDAKAWLTLVCTGFVAGYVANRLLPAVADSLYNKLKQLSDKTDEVGAKADQTQEAVGKTQQAVVKTQQAVDETNDRVTAAEEKTKLAVQLATSMVRASDYLAQNDFTKSETRVMLQAKTAAQVTTLADLVKAFPANRTLCFLLARLHDEAEKNPQAAIDVLTTFIGAVAVKTELDDGDNVNTADAYWNIATLWLEKADGKTHRDPAYMKESVAAMKESLRILPSYYDAFENDDGFKAMADLDEGKAMIAAAKTAYDAWAKTQPHKASAPHVAAHH